MTRDMDMETRNFIAGAWCDGASTIANVNPSDLSDVIGHYAQASAADLDRAVPLIEAQLTKGWDTAEAYWILAEALTQSGEKQKAEQA